MRGACLCAQSRRCSTTLPSRATETERRGGKSAADTHKENTAASTSNWWRCAGRHTQWCHRRPVLGRYFWRLHRLRLEKANEQRQRGPATYTTTTATTATSMSAPPAGSSKPLVSAKSTVLDDEALDGWDEVDALLHNNKSSSSDSDETTKTMHHKLNTASATAEEGAQRRKHQDPTVMQMISVLSRHSLERSCLP